MSSKKKVLLFLVFVFTLSLASAVGAFVFFSQDLPKLITMEDYKPLLVSEVYGRDGKKVGEFFRERRILSPFQKIPKHVVQAFLAAEDDEFYQHKGINYLAILRATLANLQAGRKVQGGSTITQQVAKTLFLSSEKSYARKIKEFFLAHQIEKNFTKDEILYLYLNQIYFGQGAHGIGTAAKTYFRKDVSDLTLEEAAILAGLPKAPSAFSPVHNPKRAKERQVYVLSRMKDVGFINDDQRKTAAEKVLKVFKKQDFENKSGYYLETIRTLLNEMIGEKALLDEGLKIYSSLDFSMQRAAEEKTQKGLRDLDKRQGFRGAIKNLTDTEEIKKFLLETRNKLFLESEDYVLIDKKGDIARPAELKIFHKADARGSIVTNIPPYIRLDQIVEGIVTKIDDSIGVVYVQFGEAVGAIDLSQMAWARKPNSDQSYSEAVQIKKPSLALNKGDVIRVRVIAPKFTSERLLKESKKKPGKNVAAIPTIPWSQLESYAGLALEQEPKVEGALLSFDNKTQEVVAMVGGYDFEKSKFNRALQSQRQTGSSFKVFVYASALEKGFNPGSYLKDVPLAYKNQVGEGQGDIEVWRPNNYGHSFEGEVLFREALKKSVNAPAVRLLESVGIDWAVLYSQRMGIFSPLNKDLSLVLGSSGVTLYEMTKAFATFARLGKRTRPLLLHKVTDYKNKELLKNVSLDVRFKDEIARVDQIFADYKTKESNKPVAAQAPAEANGNNEAAAGSPQAELPKGPVGSPFFFSDPEQVIRPQTAFVMTNILQAVVNENGGTAGKARALGRDVAGKTGTTNKYFDAWFMGYTAQLTTGVWVGFDNESSMGHGETGGDAALPIWVAYMLEASKNMPVVGFQAPDGINFVELTVENGNSPASKTKTTVRQAFVQGTEPTLQDSKKLSPREESDFFKEDMAQ